MDKYRKNILPSSDLDIQSLGSSSLQHGFLAAHPHPKAWLLVSLLFSGGLDCGLGAARQGVHFLLLALQFGHTLSDILHKFRNIRCSHDLVNSWSKWLTYAALIAFPVIYCSLANIFLVFSANFCTFGRQNNVLETVWYNFTMETVKKTEGNQREFKKKMVEGSCQ